MKKGIFLGITIGAVGAIYAMKNKSIAKILKKSCSC